LGRGADLSLAISLKAIVLVSSKSSTIFKKE